MNILHRYYWKLVITAGISFGILAVLLLYAMIPSQIYVKEGEQVSLDFQLPVTEKIVDTQVEALETIKKGSDGQTIHVTENSYVNSKETGYFKIVCRLFGLIPIKEVQAEVVQDCRLLPGGKIAGIYVETKGVLVIGTGVVQSLTGGEQEPAANIVKSGDYITAVNGEKVEEKEQVVEAVKAAGGEKVTLTILRQGEMFDVSVDPVYAADKQFKIGIWVRDDIAGIGTISYITQDGGYAILGHAISDSDSGVQVEIEDGVLYESEISNIIRGQIGVPGEMLGTITYASENVLGTIEVNSQSGVFGKMEHMPEELSLESGNEWMDTAFKQEIEIGPAQIISDVDGTRKYYDIEILSLNYREEMLNKGILFQVTDEDLLALTGGIVQGMSGSTIVQNGKIAGAVTHVLVNDPTKGYGIFIENMLEH